MADYGKWKDLPPGSATTMDFKDSDGDGVDDRKQDGPGQPAYNSGNSGMNKDSPNYTRKTDYQGKIDNQYGSQTQGQNQQSDYQQMRQGVSGLNSMMGQFYNYAPSDTDDEGRMLKNTYMMDQMSKFNDMQQAMIMAPFQAGISTALMNQQFNMEQLGASNARKEEFSYGARGMMLAKDLQNEFANAQFGRDIGMMGAAGEQTRKNYRAQGVENRLQTVTEGEQTRLNTAAVGDQNRQYRRVDGQENRLQTITEGEQQRLGIRATADETRKTYDFSDTIDARKEAREASRARGQARAF